MATTSRESLGQRLPAHFWADVAVESGATVTVSRWSALPHACVQNFRRFRAQHQRLRVLDPLRFAEALDTGRPELCAPACMRLGSVRDYCDFSAGSARSARTIQVQRQDPFRSEKRSIQSLRILP